MGRAQYIAILPPVQDSPDEFCPTKEFRTKFSRFRKLSKPEQRIPLMYGYFCPKCDREIVSCRDGLCVYSADILDVTETEVVVNVIRWHRCPGRKPGQAVTQ